jgi:hypothetical protein
MAIVQNPITGRTRKKFGTAVFAKQFEKNTMRAKALQVKNPRTKAQVTQRNKFSTIVDLLKPVVRIITAAYAGSIKKMSPFNYIASINLKNAFTGTPPVLDHTKVVLCNFEGSTVDQVTITAEANQVMKIDWVPNTIDVEELASPISIIMFNCTSNKAAIFPDVALRSVGTANVTVPQKWVGAITTVHIKTTDVNQILANAPKQIIQYKAKADLANVVK